MRERYTRGMRSALVLLALVGPAAADTPKPVNLLAAVPTVVAVSSTVDNRPRLVPLPQQRDRRLGAPRFRFSRQRRL